MSSLASIQTKFKRLMTHGDRAILKHVQNIGLITPQQRLAIYENAYFTRLAGALAADYQVLYLCLGDKEFNTLAKAYTLAHPSHFYTLRWFGQYLPVFLNQQGGKDASMMAQLAAFEWAFVDAFVSANTAMVAAEKISQIPPDSWPSLSFIFHPSVQVLAQSWDVLNYWLAGRKRTPFPVPTFFDTPQSIVVWRYDLATHYRSLDINEATALKKAMQGHSFSDICEHILLQGIKELDVAPLAITYLQKWLSEGLICDCKA